MSPPPPSALAADPAVLDRAMFLVLRILLMFDRLILLALRGPIVALRRVHACLVGVALGRMLLLIGTVLMPRRVIVGAGDDDLGHARRGDQG